LYIYNCITKYNEKKYFTFFLGMGGAGLSAKVLHLRIYKFTIKNLFLILSARNFSVWEKGILDSKIQAKLFLKMSAVCTHIEEKCSKKSTNVLNLSTNFLRNLYWKWVFCTQCENFCSCWIFEYKNTQFEYKLLE